MALQPHHQEKLVLSEDELGAILREASLEKIMALNSFPRAEALELLYEYGATCSMKANQAEDLPFEMDAPGREREGTLRTRVERHVIPGGKKPAREFPLRVAVYVAANRGLPGFGGEYYKDGPQTHPDVPPKPVRVKANPHLISFSLKVPEHIWSEPASAAIERQEAS